MIWSVVLCPWDEVIWRVESKAPRTFRVHHPVDGKAAPIVLEEVMNRPGVSL